jgi:glycine/D-amino acid oxidase-like deaminating enzyme
VFEPGRCADGPPRGQTWSRNSSRPAAKSAGRSPPRRAPSGSLRGGDIAAERFVFACGPWLGRLFPELLGPRIFPTRQEVFFFAPAPGDTRFEPARLPGWADFNDGDIYYGFPALEGRGFKIAHDAHGPPIDPDRRPRPSAGRSTTCAIWSALSALPAGAQPGAGLPV